MCFKWSLGLELGRGRLYTQPPPPSSLSTGEAQLQGGGGSSLLKVMVCESVRALQAC